MSRSTRSLLVLLGLIAPVFGQAAADWSKIKTGITPVEAAAALGKPLIQTKGHGIQLWIYDGCGEIVFGGDAALGWTQPSPTPESLSRPVELDVLLRPVVRLPTLRSLILQSQSAQTYEDPLDTRFRYQPR